MIYPPALLGLFITGAGGGGASGLGPRFWLAVPPALPKPFVEVLSDAASAGEGDLEVEESRPNIVEDSRSREGTLEIEAAPVWEFLRG